MTDKPRAARILLAEDEKNLAAGIAYNLEKRGFEVQIASRGDHALEAASTQPFDLIILDVMMPRMSGFHVCQELRKQQIHTPILMLTARHETENRVKGIRMGADDYLGKPFDLEELVARCESLLRRRHWDDSLAGENTLFRIGAVAFDSNLLTLSNDQTKVTLTAIEARLLHLLIAQQGRTVTRAELLKKVWGLREETQTRTLDNFIMRLRHHLESVGGSKEWIESVRGVGYRLAPVPA